MEVISIERSTYEELLTSFNSFVTKMKEMASRGNDKGLGDWLDNQDVCQILSISPRTLQTLRDNGTLAEVTDPAAFPLKVVTFSLLLPFIYKLFRTFALENQYKVEQLCVQLR